MSNSGPHGPLVCLFIHLFILTQLFIYSYADVFPQPFEGAKVVISKPLSSHFQVSHNVTMSQLQPSGYRFGATYIGSKQLSPIEVIYRGSYTHGHFI